MTEIYHGHNLAPYRRLIKNQLPDKVFRFRSNFGYQKPFISHEALIILQNLYKSDSIYYSPPLNSTLGTPRLFIGGVVERLLGNTTYSYENPAFPSYSHFHPFLISPSKVHVIPPPKSQVIYPILHHGYNGASK